MELKVSSVATGHHAGDIAAYALKAMLIHDYDSLIKLVLRMDTMRGGVVRVLGRLLG